MAKITDNEFNLLREYIREHCGIGLGDEKAYLIETRLSKLMALNGCESFGDFYRVVKGQTNGDLRDKIIDAMTTNETLWFRDKHPFTILKNVMFPTVLKKIKPGEKVRIWSGASSTGQEPYSIAMTIHEYCREHPGVKPEQFEIMGTDISASALFIATAGRYDSFAMDRGMPPDMRQRYMKEDGRVTCADDKLKKLVTFKKFNLQDSLAPLGRFDIVFLRYVAIYFSLEFKRELVERIARIVNDPGYLIVGAVESLRGVSDAFEISSHDGGFYYTRAK
jgi:chemotaxis protein methyltransferase CheR